MNYNIIIHCYSWKSLNGDRKTTNDLWKGQLLIVQAGFEINIPGRPMRVLELCSITIRALIALHQELYNCQCCVRKVTVSVFWMFYIFFEAGFQIEKNMGLKCCFLLAICFLTILNLPFQSFQREFSPFKKAILRFITSFKREGQHE